MKYFALKHISWPVSQTVLGKDHVAIATPEYFNIVMPGLIHHVDSLSQSAR